MEDFAKKARKAGAKMSFALATLALVFTLGLSAVPSVSVFAGDDAKNACSGASDKGLMGYKNCGRGTNSPDNLFGDGGWITTIINIALFIVGIASVIMIIYSGIRYTTSRGEGKAVESAKNTMLYAIMGLIIAIVAYALINFVISSIAK